MLKNSSSTPPVTKLIAPLAMVAALLGCSRREDSVTVTPTHDAATQTDQQNLRTAFDLYQRGESSEAFEIVQQVLIASPDEPTALRLAVDIQRQRGHMGEAGDLARRAADVDPSRATSMLMIAFECHLRVQDFPAAEQDLRRAAELKPDMPQVHRQLAQLLNAQGRRLEASTHVRQLIRLRDIQPNELLSLIDLRGPFLLASFDEFTKDVPLSLFSLGKVRLEYATQRAAPDDHLKLVESVIEAFPDSTAAAAFRCRILADNDRFAELSAALKDVPPGIDEQAEYWFSMGVLLAHEDRHREAIRAFAEALRRDPTDRESLRAMISSCLSIEETEHSLFLRDRLAELDLIFRTARDADEEQARWISKTLESQVRPWEATAWLMHAARSSGKLPSVIPELDRRHRAISDWESEASDKQLADVRLESLLGFQATEWPMPDRMTLPEISVARVAAGTDSLISFADIAGEVGIETSFVSGFPLDGGEFSTYQVNGGGLAILDYDLDGRCDVYVVQSGGDPHLPQGSAENQLYRHLPSQRFAEVTGASRVGDRHFGQGVCAGDLNQDGFPDLLVANIGSNTLYINQGDGTYRQSTDLLADNPFAWTSSVGVGDLDGDHLPEIVEINYIDDPQAYAVKCDSNYMDCQPQRFRKCQDRVLRCLPDGTFSPWPSFASQSPTAKLGFGLVIANFDKRHGNDFFVSNDGDFNHYWVSKEAANPMDAPFDLIESANPLGCSIGRGGNSQACMGIASGDFNRDGMLDLHVTNFHNEPVNLFLQTKSGIFTDQASSSGLGESSFGVLGFGTQSADFDNDGWLDLAVLNGHVYDGRADGIPFHMLPQLLSGSRDGFRLLDPSAVGTYWQQKQLGRTLAMLDWNRDGRVDLLANHLDLPIALLQNNATAGNWLQLELVGVTSERDATGAEVHVEMGGEHWTAFQTGGDGFMCTNESMLHFGLGSAQSMAQIEVRWPSGTSTVFRDVAPNSRYLIVEDVPEPYRR